MNFAIYVSIGQLLQYFSKSIVVYALLNKSI